MTEADREDAEEEKCVVFNKFTGAYLIVFNRPVPQGSEPSEMHIDTLDPSEATVFPSHEKAQEYVDFENKEEPGEPWMIGIPGVLDPESVRDFVARSTTCSPRDHKSSGPSSLKG